MSTNVKKASMMQNVQEDQEDVIDLLDMAYSLIDKWYYLLLSLLAGAVLFNAWAFFCIEPTYESTSKLYVASVSNDAVVNLSDLNLGTSLTKDYEQLMLSYPVLNQVIDKLSLDTTSDELANLYTLSNPSDTRILEIKATSTDPQLAVQLADTMAEVAVDYLPETMNTMAPNIAQHAKIAEHKANPSYSKYTLMGALLGLLLCAGIFIAGYLLDDTVHTAEDMEKYFGIVPLTTIPDSDEVIDHEDDEEYSRKRGGKQ